MKLSDNRIDRRFDPKQASSDVFNRPVIEFDDKSSILIFGQTEHRFVGNIVSGPDVAEADRRTVKLVTPDCSVTLFSVGNSDGDNIDVHVISKFVSVVRIQLHDAEVGQRFAEVNGRIN